MHLQPGLYQHHKGRYYWVHDLARYSETEEWSTKPATALSRKPFGRAPWPCFWKRWMVSGCPDSAMWGKALLNPLRSAFKPIPLPLCSEFSG